MEITLDENGADTVPVEDREFKAYNAYVGECKAEAKELLTNQAGSSVTGVE